MKSNTLIEQLRDRVQFARGVNEMLRTDEAEKLWDDVYPKLSDGKPGLLGCVLNRAEAQVLRLSCIYALMDNCSLVDVPHLQAASALWDYCEKLARMIFGETLGDPIADRILDALDKQDMSDSEILHLVFKRNVPASEIQRALATLKAQGKITSYVVDTSGRPKTMWKKIKMQ